VFLVVNTPANCLQQSISGSIDMLIKSTIFEEDEDTTTSKADSHVNILDDDMSLPAFPELQYLDLSYNLVRQYRLCIKCVLHCL
jgi:hypothetical protein